MSDREEFPLEEGGSGRGTVGGGGDLLLPEDFSLEEEYPDFLCQNDEIDRMIEERAGAFNLTGTNIRNILYVSNVCLDLSIVIS